MTWYNTGTVAVTSGSPTVNGSGTAWTDYVDAGQGFKGPDGKLYEILTVNSATQLTLNENYSGSTASGQGYKIAPLQGYIRDLALSASNLLLSFSSVRDNAGAGMFGDGSAATPGVRFVNDQDTGFYRPGTNTIACAVNGTEIFRCSTAGFTFADPTNVRTALGLGTSATRNTGNSGATVPLLDGANTWSAKQTLSGDFQVGGLAGFGTASPSADVHVRKSGNVEVKSETTSSANNAYGRLTLATGISNSYCSMEVTNGDGSPYRITANGPGVPTAYDDSDTHYFRKSDGTQKAVLQSNGYVAFGPQGATAPLDLATPAGRVLLTGGGGLNQISSVNTANNAGLPLIVYAGNNFYVALNGTTRFQMDATGLYAGADNTQTLGWSGNRWSGGYIATAWVVTSDERAKQDIAAIPDEWLDAWSAVNWKRYKFIDAVEAKGDNARWHLGLVAQAVRDAFADRGLDAEKIGLLCYDEWDEQTAPVSETVTKTRLIDGPEGSFGPFTETYEEQVDTGETRVTLETGDRWGLRYDECFALEATYQRRRMDRIEARLALLDAA